MVSKSFHRDRFAVAVVSYGDVPCTKAVRLHTVVPPGKQEWPNSNRESRRNGDGTDTPYAPVLRTHAGPDDSVPPANLVPFPESSPVEFVGNLLQGLAARFGRIA